MEPTSITQRTTPATSHALRNFIIVAIIVFAGVQWVKSASHALTKAGHPATNVTRIAQFPGANIGGFSTAEPQPGPWDPCLTPGGSCGVPDNDTAKLCGCPYPGDPSLEPPGS